MSGVAVDPAKFVREVRSEVAKVTWPSRKETGITTAMVFLMVFFCSIFFLAVDFLLGKGVDLLLQIGG